MRLSFFSVCLISSLLGHNAEAITISTDEFALDQHVEADNFAQSLSSVIKDEEEENDDSQDNTNSKGGKGQKN